MSLISRAAIFLALTVATGAAAEDECRFYTYRATVTEVIDGDTLRANVDLGFRIWVNAETFRLYGIDAPESRGLASRKVTEAEKERGRASKAALKKLVEGRAVALCTISDKRGKYGRYLARIFVDDLDVNQWLVDQGYAVPYGDVSAGLN